jgi:lipopolysaccharide/colanic/teichoic acid biosynthesis glycosyltransferase
MTISTITNLGNSFASANLEQEEPSAYCNIIWRRGKLLVKQVGEIRQPYLPATDNKESLAECLKHSPVNLVLIDPELGFSKVKFWADATKSSGKSIYLNIPSIEPSKQNTSEWLQITLNWIMAFLILAISSPVAFWLAILVRIYSPGSLFTREWHVGKRGKLFQVIKFRTIVANKHDISELSYQNNLRSDFGTNYTLFGRLMSKYGLENIPQLLNVLRGEMSLFGRRQSKLEDALKLDSVSLKQLNKTPGMINSWQMAPESKLLHLDSQTL